MNYQSDDVKTSAILTADADDDAVAFAPTKLAWKPRPTSAQRVAVEASQLFCASNNPLEHTLDDAGKFFQLDSEAWDVFYHNGFCGDNVAKRVQQHKTSAMMVRRAGVRLKDELLSLDGDGALGAQTGWLLNGERGVGKSMVLNYVVAAMQRAGWLVAVMPHAADWTLGLSARSAQWGNEAYRITDTNYWTHVPPALEGSPLYEHPEASAHWLLSLYLSQREKLEQIPIKDPERAAHYAERAADPKRGPTLADILGPYARDRDQGFADFPMPVRPVHDVLSELQAVTEYPTLLVVDGWNRWSQMATSCHWRSKRPLHASDLLVPATCGGDLAYGAGMARGVMLCATSLSGGQPPTVPMRLRKRIAPPPEFNKPDAVRRDLRFYKLTRDVSPYRLSEVQAMLDFYALVGHMTNPALDEQLRTGELATKVRLMTAGVGEDVYKIAQQM